MKLKIKYLLLFVLLLATCENSIGCLSLDASPPGYPETVSTEPKCTLLFFQNANNSDLSHGEKIETTLIPTPSYFDNGIKFLYRGQIPFYKQKENSTNSFIILFESKNLNRRSLNEILRI